MCTYCGEWHDFDKNNPWNGPHNEIYDNDEDRLFGPFKYFLPINEYFYGLL